MRLADRTADLSKTLLVAFVGLALGAPLACGETYVTTYVVKTQEEREQTRWTLTEWLRIKERMKMMDVWLAMFSDPEKDKFKPELMLDYGLTRGSFKYSAQSGSESGTLSGSSGRAQAWLTNLISGTVGIRTLNIDLGVEGGKREAGSYSSSGFNTSSAAGATANATAAVPGTAATSPAAAAAALGAQRTLDSTYYSGDLRIFGKNIQDSSVVLKYGQYTAHNSILDAVGPSTAATTGTVAGIDLQLYVLRFLGAEGSYMQFGNTSSVKGSTTQLGRYYDYMGFIEVSLLRIEAGLYSEDWSTERLGQPITSQERGSIAGVKLSF